MKTVEKLYAAVFLLIGAFILLKRGNIANHISATAGNNLDSIIQALQGKKVNAQNPSGFSS